MSTTTDNLSLELPDATDYVQLNVLNSNFEKIDNYCNTDGTEGSLNINTDILDSEQTNILTYNKINNVCYVNGTIYFKSDIVLKNEYLLGGNAPAPICGQVALVPGQQNWISVDTVGNIYLNTSDITFDFSTLNPINFGFMYINKINIEEEQG